MGPATSCLLGDEITTRSCHHHHDAATTAYAPTNGSRLPGHPAHCLDTRRVLHLRGRVNGLPRRWSGCRPDRAAGTKATPPPRHTLPQCTERAAAPWHTLHLCIVRAHCRNGRRMRRPWGLRRHACSVTKSPRAVVTITTTPPPRHMHPPTEADCLDTQHIAWTPGGFSTFAAVSTGCPGDGPVVAPTAPPAPRRRPHHGTPCPNAPNGLLHHGTRCTYASCGHIAAMGDACVAPTMGCGGAQPRMHGVGMQRMVHAARRSG